MHVLLPLTFFKSQTLMLHRLSMVMIHYMSFHHSTTLLLHHFVILSFLCFVVSLLHHSYHALLLHRFVIVLMFCCFIILSLLSCSIIYFFSYNIVGLLFAHYLVNYYFITQARKVMFSRSNFSFVPIMELEYLNSKPLNPKLD